MKKLGAFLMCAVMALGLFGCGSSDGTESKGITQADTGKTLVVYFSATGNTKTAAEYIQAEMDADIFEIMPKDAYTFGYTNPQ